MKYVDWVAIVWKTTAEMLHEQAHRGVGVPIPEIAKRLGLADPYADPGFHGSPERMAIIVAATDLQDLYLGAIDGAYGNISLTEEGRKGRSARLEQLWPQLFEGQLDEELSVFLTAATGLAEIRRERLASIAWVEAEDVYRDIGWTWPDLDRVYDITLRLEELHLIRRRASMGGLISVQPTYRGIVRATERAESEAQATLRELLAAGESTNVDFKRELRLDRDKEKAEFVRDVLGIGNVQLRSARRFIVVGFEDETLVFYATLDPSLTQERLEQVLHAYSKPPQIKTTRVAWGGGHALLIEVVRDAKRVPHRATRDFGGRLTAGAVYVRHGRHTVEASAEEIADLESEPARAS